jgi:hypothetical protein
MARRGRNRRRETETLYWQLVSSGVGTVRACQEAGIGRKTGYRWRAENGGLPPGRVAEEARSGRYLSRLERQRIATLHRQGLGVRAIAERLGRAPSTVSRELRRNMRPQNRAATTATWRTPGPGNGPAAPAAGGCWPTPGCGRRSRPSWSGNGARSRSPRTCAAPTRPAHQGGPRTGRQHGPPRRREPCPCRGRSRRTGRGVCRPHARRVRTAHAGVRARLGPPGLPLPRARDRAIRGEPPAATGGHTEARPPRLTARCRPGDHRA